MTTEEKRAYSKRWREAHKEYLKEYNKRDQKEHKEQINANARRRYSKNREKYLSYQREWRKMKEYDATEIAFKNGYKQGVKDTFETIMYDCFDQYGYLDYDAFFELKKKYTED